MLSRPLRLKRPQDFQNVWRRGERWRDDTLTLGILPNKFSHNRFGFVVSRRIGKAVSRNLIKRRLRAAVRYWLPGMATGYDVVITAHSPVTSVTYHELEAALGRLLRLARLLTA